MAIEIDNRIGTAHGHGLAEARSEISADAMRFAETHGLCGYLFALNSMILSRTDLVSSVRVELDEDDEVCNWFTICFVIQTKGSVPEVLEFDGCISDFMIESIPARERMFFALQFPFDEP